MNFKLKYFLICYTFIDSYFNCKYNSNDEKFKIEYKI